jgi:uncharacterized protein (DUF58 family)
MPLTWKGFAYLILAYGFIGLALLLREPVIAIFVIPLAFVIFVSSGLGTIQDGPLSVARELHPSRSFGGESVDVTLKVRNKSNKKFDAVYLEDSVPRPLVLEAGTKHIAVSLRPGEAVEYSYRISAPLRGSYVLGPLLFRLSDTMGFHEHSGQVRELSDLRIYPRVEKLGPIELRARRVGPWPGMVPSRNIGPGSEFFELRLYSPGDELRRINWKASAKLARLVTSEYEGEQVTDVLLVLDCSEGALSKLFEYNAVEFEVSLAASLCSQLIHQGNRVGLSVYGAVRTWVDPAFGKRQLLRLLDNLAIAKAGRPTVPMGYAVQSVIVAVVPSRSVIVFISPLMGDEVAGIIANVATRGYSLLCLAPALMEGYEGMPEVEMIARRVLSVERKLRLLEIAKYAKVIELSPETSTRFLLKRKGTWSTN